MNDSSDPSTAVDSDPSTSSETDDADEPTLSEVVGRIAARLEGLSTGEQAELRRISPDEPYSPTLWRVLLECVPEYWTERTDDDEQARIERRWATLLMAMAMNVGGHTYSHTLGEALAEHGWSEVRFVRLMRADGDTLVKQVRRLAQWMASKELNCDWTDVARLLLNQAGEWAEKHRRDIARDYYEQFYADESSA